MKHDPHSDLEKIIFQTLFSDFQVPYLEAHQIAIQLEKYLVVNDIGGPYFELLNVTMNLNRLCGHILLGGIVHSSRWFAGVPLLGILRWFDTMRYYHPINRSVKRDSVKANYIEAAVCLALCKQESEARHFSPDDTVVALLKRVNAVLIKGKFDTIEAPRLQEAMDRLEALHCLTPRDGFFRLKEEMNYQIPEE